MKHTLLANESKLSEVALALLETHPQERVFGFFGEMGTGKTTLIKEICRQLGVTGGMTSPTFAIVNEYWTEDGEPLYHFDFYRIDDPDDAIPRINWGKYVLRDGRWMLNVTLTANHRFIDGYHVGLFFEQLQQEIDRLG